MKTSLLSTNRVFGAAILAAVALVSVSPGAYAKDKDKGKDRGKPSQSSGRGFDSRRDDSRRDDHRHDHEHDNDARRRFFAQPRSGFCLTLGNGYAGQGYYYGPPNAAYYYQGNGIAYYTSRERAPSQYRGYPVTSGARQYAVQRTLARIGYYNGPIDGIFGPGTRDAIARFQRSRGLRVTGGMTEELLRKLALD